MLRILALAGLLLLSLTAPARPQGLRDLISQLFIFGSGEQPLFLAGTADPNNPAAVQAHGDHFIPAAVEGNANLIAFLTRAIATSAANLPVSATSSGRTFQFVGGVPVATSTSPGPIFGERAQTLGRGRVFVGASYTKMRFTSLRGVDLENIQVNFTHVNADFPGCDSVFGADCSLMGVPTLENEYIELRLSLQLDMTATLFVLTYGLTDFLDVGAALPIVSTTLRGRSEAQVVPFGGPLATHFFAGTRDRPVLSASRNVEGSATGVGDLAARIKLRLGRSERAGFAVLADARFPTGSEQDLLGSGEIAVRTLGIVSARFGDFSPHANVGYLYRSGDQFSDAVVAVAGFDHALSPWATVAVDLMAELAAGDSKLSLPDPTTIDVPFRRIIQPGNIPNRRDDIVNGALGIKLEAAPGLWVIANALWPLNRGGLRPNAAWTVALEYSF
ncbi:MAG: hypothetical protein KatS3mg081_2527 [Gemmatimonadales bacterium]|nr:MAG: hypothetical protein KatS3mg081_2527 [Gemmatimonadales bacterium]